MSRKNPTILNAPMRPVDYRSQSALSDHAQGENDLAAQLDAVGIAYERQAKVIPGRKFTFDFKVGADLLVEVEGGVFSGGRHVRGVGFTDGCVKQALAVIAGFRLLRVTTEHVHSGQALVWIEKATEGES